MEPQERPHLEFSPLHDPEVTAEQPRIKLVHAATLVFFVALVACGFLLVANNGQVILVQIDSERASD